MARSVLFRPSFRSVIAREQLGKLDDAPPHGGVLDRSERSGEGEPVRAREEVRVLRISALSSSSERPSIIATMGREACQAPRRALGDGPHNLLRNILRNSGARARSMAFHDVVKLGDQVRNLTYENG
jgi:hypothetical protein